jgi:mannose-6-phosphate isomerase-like protein (cupin superfamily)
MTENVRRVVTGHDENGKAIVTIDEVITRVSKIRPGHSAALIWSTTTFPIDNNDPTDGAAKPVGPPPKGGTVFRITTYQPGIASRFHRSQVFECGVVLSGEVELVLDDTSVRLKAGDCLVQRGTIHDWINHGPEPCVMALINMDATPIKIGDRILGPEG